MNQDESKNTPESLFFPVTVQAAKTSGPQTAPAPVVEPAPAAPAPPEPSPSPPLQPGEGTTHKEKLQTLLTEVPSNPRGYKQIAAASRTKGSRPAPAPRALIITTTAALLAIFVYGVYMIVQRLAPLTPAVSKLSAVTDKLTQIQAPKPAAMLPIGGSPTFPINPQATQDPTDVVKSYFSFAQGVATSNPNAGTRVPAFSTPRFMTSYSQQKPLYSQLPPATGFHSSIQKPKRHKHTKAARKAHQRAQ